MLDGEVDTHSREGGEEKVVRLKAEETFHAETGDGHFAAPVGEARLLLVECAGSV